MFYLSTSIPQFSRTDSALQKTRNCCIADGTFVNASIPTHLTAIALSELRAVLDSKRWTDLSNLLANQGFPSMQQCPNCPPILNPKLESVEQLASDSSIISKYSVSKYISAVAAYACTIKRLSALYAACSSVASDVLIELLLFSKKEESAQCIKWKSRSEILSNTIIAKLSETTSKRIAVEIGTDLKIEKETAARQQVELQLGITLARTKSDAFRITELENNIATLKTENVELQTRLEYSIKSVKPNGKTVEKKSSKEKQVADLRSNRHKPDLVVNPPSLTKAAATTKTSTSPTRPATSSKLPTSPTKATVSSKSPNQSAISPTTASAKQLAKFMDQSLMSSSSTELVKSAGSSSSSSTTPTLLSPSLTPRRPGHSNQINYHRRKSSASSISSSHSLSAFQKGDSSASSSGTSSESEEDEEERKSPRPRPRPHATALQLRPSSMVESNVSPSRKLGRRMSDTGLFMETSSKKEAMKGSKLKFSLVRQGNTDKEASFEKKLKSWFKDSRLG